MVTPYRSDRLFAMTALSASRRIGPCRALAATFLVAVALEPGQALAQVVPGLLSSLGGEGDHLSPMAMFLNADIVVKAVMVGLAFASVVTWTIGLAKFIELAVAKRRAERAFLVVAQAADLAAAQSALGSTGGAVPRLVAAASAEAARSGGLPGDGVKERAAALLARIEAGAGRAMTRGTGLLATIGSTSPFVGLFGTVWGIMNSFIGIAKSNTTNLAVVAPGIAEALLATAIGLVAAIPAVILYNVFARGITGYRAALVDASEEVLRHLSRDLDRQAQAPGAVIATPRAA